MSDSLDLQTFINVGVEAAIYTYCISQPVYTLTNRTLGWVCQSSLQTETERHLLLYNKIDTDSSSALSGDKVLFWPDDCRKQQQVF